MEYFGEAILRPHGHLRPPGGATAPSGSAPLVTPLALPPCSRTISRLITFVMSWHQMAPRHSYTPVVEIIAVKQTRPSVVNHVSQLSQQ